MNLRIVISVLLLTLSAVLPVQGENQEPAQLPDQDRQVERSGERKREIACSCCKQCRAAKKEIRGKEEGPPPKNGCLDCCRRCGSSDVQDPRKLPPEIVK